MGAGVAKFEKMRTFAKKSAHNERRLLNFSYSSL